MQQVVTFLNRYPLDFTTWLEAVEYCCEPSWQIDNKKVLELLLAKKPLNNLTADEKQKTLDKFRHSGILDSKTKRFLEACHINGGDSFLEKFPADQVKSCRESALEDLITSRRNNKALQLLTNRNLIPEMDKSCKLLILDLAAAVNDLELFKFTLSTIHAELKSSNPDKYLAVKKEKCFKEVGITNNVELMELLFEKGFTHFNITLEKIIQANITLGNAEMVVFLIKKLGVTKDINRMEHYLLQSAKIKKTDVFKAIHNLNTSITSSIDHSAPLLR